MHPPISSFASVFREIENKLLERKVVDKERKEKLVVGFRFWKIGKIVRPFTGYRTEEEDWWIFSICVISKFQSRELFNFPTAKSKRFGQQRFAAFLWFVQAHASMLKKSYHFSIHFRINPYLSSNFRPIWFQLLVITFFSCLLSEPPIFASLL